MWVKRTPPLLRTGVDGALSAACKALHAVRLGDLPINFDQNALERVSVAVAVADLRNSEVEEFRSVQERRRSVLFELDASAVAEFLFNARPVVERKGH